MSRLQEETSPGSPQTPVNQTCHPGISLLQMEIYEAKMVSFEEQIRARYKAKLQTAQAEHSQKLEQAQSEHRRALEAQRLATANFVLGHLSRERKAINTISHLEKTIGR